MLSIFIYLFAYPYTVITNIWKGYDKVMAARFETGVPRIADVVIIFLSLYSEVLYLRIGL